MRRFVVAALVLAGCRPVSDREKPATETVEAPRGGPLRVLYPSAPGSFVELVDELGPSVVHLTTTRPVRGGSASILPGAPAGAALGSGFVVGIEGKNYILSNAHVVAQSGDIHAVFSDGTKHKARVIGRDSRLDVALLEVDAEARLTPLRLGDSSTLRVGEWLLVLGNPFGEEVTASQGIASSLGIPSGLSVGGTVTATGLMQVDAAIHPGNSGGPVVNMAGEVVAVATALEERRSAVGFAVPIVRAKQVLPMLSRDGYVTRPWLGLKVLPMNEPLALELGLSTATGALVSDVVAGPAVKAGLQRGDVILKYGDTPVDHRTLPDLVTTSGMSPKRLTIWRDKKELSLVITPEPIQ